MVRYSAHTRVRVEPLARQPQRDGLLVGLPDRSVFLVLPADAVDVLDDLARGQTVGDAQARCHERTGETPDMEAFLTQLEQRGFVRPIDAAGAAAPFDTPRERAQGGRQPHFEWISPRWASRLCGTATMTLAAIVIALAAAAVMLKPGLIPGWRAAYFPQYTGTGLLWLMSIGVFTTFIHEMAHLVAARARGVSCRFGIGNRLWFVVWETDMTGIWALPRRRRYLPLLAGPLVDLVSASALLLLFFAHASGWIALTPRTEQFGRALLFIYLMRIVWQCYFFVRTDFYYAITNLLGCTSLMQDTQVYLRNIVARLTGIGRVHDQRDVPSVERRMLGVYAVIWIAGRALALTVLVFVQFPLLLQYLALFGQAWLGGASSGTDGISAGATVPALVAVTFMLAGLAMWLRQLLPKKGVTS
jgi:putative peptide zinc metalloprotease protein